MPLKKWITILEGDFSKISEVVEAFYEIKTHFLSDLPASHFLKGEDEKVLSFLEKRRNMCLRPIHFAANVLDPKFKAEHIEPDECVKGLEYIYKIASSMKDVDDVNVVLENLADYRSADNFFAKPFVQDSAKNTNIKPRNFWKAICSNLQLAPVAEAILGMPPTSALTERSFSTQGGIHTKRRNKLTANRAAKLTYINHNLKLLKVNYKEQRKRGECEMESRSRIVESDTEIVIRERDSEESDDEHETEDEGAEMDDVEEQEQEMEDVDEEGRGRGERISRTQSN